MSGTSLSALGPTTHNTDGIFEDLKAIQREFGYISPDKLEAIAEARGLHLGDVHAIASFYPHFHLKPPARIDVRVCTDMSCHLRGAGALRSELTQRLKSAGIGDCSVRETSCLGRCDRAPALMISTRADEQIYDHASAESVAETVARNLKGESLPQTHPERLNQELHSDPYVGTGKYGVLRNLLETRDYAGVIAQLKASGLRGMGGAGFPTGTKWEAVRNCAGDEKYVICNAD